MDGIFQKSTNVFNVVKVAKHEPHRYDDKGNLLVKYEDTEQARRASSTGRRASSAAYEKATASRRESFA